MRTVAVSYIFILLSLLINIGDVTEADDPMPNFSDVNCTITRNYSSNSPYQFTLTSLLFNLSSQVSINKAFYNTSYSVEFTSDTIYVLFFCRGDISTQLCQDCVEDASKQIVSKCPNNKEAIIWYEECLLRYSDRYFFSAFTEWPRSNMERKVIEKMLNDVSRFSSTEIRPLNMSCSTTKNFTVDSAYYFNLKKLLSSFVLSSNGTTKMGFNSIKVDDKNPIYTMYGLFMCRGDVSPQLCHKCVNNASQSLFSKCFFSKEAIIWYEICLLRYSSNNFFSIMETSPKFIKEGMNIRENQEDFFEVLSMHMLVIVVTKVTKSGANKFATKEFSDEYEGQTLYTLAQCTPDLSNQDCNTCLELIEKDLNLCCRKKQGGLVIYPSCNLRFETYPFYDKRSISVVESHNKPPPTPFVSGFLSTGKGRVRSPTIIILVVVLVFVALALVFFCLAYYLWQRKQRKNKAILKENFGSESATLESLQFSLATIEAATNYFSKANKIGKGGFGEVYKGVLSDGREIVVKRLSKCFAQGVIEFKNEILLIAKLQHRNLVALLGFCLEEQEKMLVNEFVSNNKSLDYFLFGSQKRRVLSWPERNKIIEGIAHGILYLHEHSRFKVIHRDLKPGNILLDDEMNPKISDFGMARMVAITEFEGSTNRIVGTYGYIAPEYAMFGQFSEKSDVFSFGVMVLEIISGKKNISCHHQLQHADGFLSYVWKQWREERWSEILDSNMIELESHSEVMNKCIHIGLLCVQENPSARPSMITVVQYLSNDLIQLPFPQEPAFFIHGGMESIRELGSSSGQHANINESTSCSVNQMSLTELHPR